MLNNINPLDGVTESPMIVALAKLQIGFLNEQYVFLGELDEEFGRHSRHSGKILIDKKQRELLRRINELKEVINQNEKRV